MGLDGIDEPIQNQPMKILFNLGVFGKHGVEHALINILPQLRVPNSQFYLHEIYEPDYPSPLLEKIKDFTIHICSLPRHSFWGNIHMNRRKNLIYRFIDGLGIFKIHSIVSKKINKFEVDVVVDYDLSLLRSANKIKSPIIGVFHFRPKNFRSGNSSKLKRIGKRLRSYKKLIVLCPEMLKEACEVWPYLAEKFVVLPNSIDIQKIDKNSKQVIHLPEGVQANEYFLTIARLTHQKNISLMLEAFHHAKQQGCDWKLIIIGEGEDKNELIAKSNKLGIGSQAIFMGYQENPYPYIKLSGAFISSSREEGFPVSLIEAISLSCPIVALACPTGPTDILENGLLGSLVPFTEDNPNQLAQAMTEISRNQDLKNSYKIKMKDKSDKYSSIKLGKDFSDLITSCCKK